ncbi:hypothetical protein CDAR_255841 [Caerostris darwini]|uniref:Uncharacterized protein n=1 Tax=Caerostris darwini TaxID=1538125 RepID=A0AAV4WZD1_9ARAC|nr:hypothetical protein CDAR_255841 [Caerostris darwini]
MTYKGSISLPVSCEDDCEPGKDASSNLRCGESFCHGGKGFWTCHGFDLSKSSSKAIREGWVELFRPHGRAQMNIIEDCGFNMCHWKCGHYWSMARMCSVSLINVRQSYLLHSVSNIGLRDAYSLLEEVMTYKGSISLPVSCEDDCEPGKDASSNLRCGESFCHDPTILTPHPLLFKLAKSQFPAAATEPKPMINSFDFELTVMFPLPPSIPKDAFLSNFKTAPPRAGISPFYSPVSGSRGSQWGEYYICHRG